MIVRYVTVLIVLCVFLIFVRAIPPQSTNAETRSVAAATSTGEQQPTMTRSLRTVTRDGEPTLNIHVYRGPDGVLKAIPQTQRTPTAPERVTEPKNSIPTECMPRNGNRCKRDRDIVFPDELNRTSNVHCDGYAGQTTYCLEVDDYPESIIAQHLSNDIFKYESFFGDDQMISEITQRINEDPDGELCTVEKHIIYPKKGVTINDDWKFIIQTADGKQGVLVEKCGEQRQCSHGAAFAPNGFTAVCKQHYVYRRMLSAGPNGDAFTVDYFQMPSCCKCVLQRISP